MNSLTERRAEIERLIFHPKYGGGNPDLALAFAGAILGRKIVANDLDALESEDEEKLRLALQRHFPCLLDAAVQAVIKSHR